jgi:hypothetical protein
VHAVRNRYLFKVDTALGAVRQFATTQRPSVRVAITVTAVVDRITPMLIFLIGVIMNDSSALLSTILRT